MKDFFNRIGVLGLVFLPILGILIALPFFIKLGWISLITEMLILAIAACGNNLIMGYAGMVSFGPAGPYAVGAYTTGLLLVKAGTPFGLAIIAGSVMAGLASILIGWFCVRRTHVYFSLLNLAFAQLIYTIIQKWYSFTGGDDGLIGIPIPGFLASIENYYYFTLLVAVICLIIMWLIVNSPFGKIIQGIRENPRRAEFISVNVRRYQLGVFVISGFFLGVAGSLYSGFNGSIFPSNVDLIKTTDILVVCLLGGMHNFLGPVLGSGVYILLNKIIVNYTEYWAIILGMIIVLLVVFAKGGIAGFISGYFSSTKMRQEKR